MLRCTAQSVSGLSGETAADTERLAGAAAGAESHPRGASGGPSAGRTHPIHGGFGQPAVRRLEEPPAPVLSPDISPAEQQS